MDRLRALFSDAGFGTVETYIASGNVLFDSPLTDSAALEEAIERMLHAALGYEVATFVRTPGEMAAVAAMQPFGAAGEVDTRSLYVAFLREPPPASYQERLFSFRSATDDFRVVGRESYWSCAGRMSESPYFKAKPDREVVSTSRNITTVRKLAALLAKQ